MFPMCLLVTPPVPHPFLVLPPEIMGGAYLTGLDERAAVVSRHFMVNKSEINIRELYLYGLGYVRILCVCSFVILSTWTLLLSFYFRQ